ncbi:hypothetical protein [Gynuella sunshinyii]|uniref:hypothetical protein n=1 Tax=Gynuella sunshinyii TaxID=1445505 RepID=UPI0005CC2399|nr:hypothetical protein [Gynuella sunshinyii]
MSKYHDDSTAASDPGGVSLSSSKLDKFRKELPFLKRIFANLRYPPEMLDEHLNLGDSRAAVVLETRGRLIVAAYTDELDCVALLEFPVSLVEEKKLKIGEKLLTVNTYSKGESIASDLENGPKSYKRYNNFYPLIADFLSDDYQTIEKRKSIIDENEWKKTVEMGERKLGNKDFKPRNGSPYTSILVAR